MFVSGKFRSHDEKYIFKTHPPTIKQSNNNQIRTDDIIYYSYLL